MYKVFFKERTIFFTAQIPQFREMGSGQMIIVKPPENIIKLLGPMFFDLEKLECLYLIDDDPEILFDRFSGYFEKIEAAGGLVKSETGQFIVIRRHDIWDLPKGKHEQGESYEETAIREVSEECGLEDVKIRSFLLSTFHIYRENGKDLMKETRWYDMLSSTEEKTAPQLQENITEVRWTPEKNSSFILDNTFPSIVEVLMAGQVL